MHENTLHLQHPRPSTHYSMHIRNLNLSNSHQSWSKSDPELSTTAELVLLLNRLTIANL